MNLFIFKNFFWNIIKKIASLSFAIAMLFIIAFLSMLGSIIEQDQNLSFYQLNYPIKNQLISIFNWKIIIFLGLDNIYQSWWFLLILLFFALSLLTCTFTLQLPSLKNARRWKFINTNQKKVDKNIFDTEIPIDNSIHHSFINFIYALNDSSFYVFQKGQTLYSYKGIIGRLAPIFVHISILVILMGTMLGIFSGFMIQEMVSEGEIFHLKNIINSGIFSYIPIDFTGRINSFNIDYNIDGSIRQFFSSIEVLDRKGIPFFHQTISVNSPLVYKGLTFYQTDWSIDALRIQIGDHWIIQKQLDKIDLNHKKGWLCHIFLGKEKEYILLLFNKVDPIYIYDKSKDKMFAVDVSQPIYLNNIKLIIKNIMISTGLQVKSDPGVIIVYMGFFGIMLSTLSSYISYTQIWIIQESNRLKCSGLTNRAILFFEEDVQKINSNYQKYTFIL